MYTRLSAAQLIEALGDSYQTIDLRLGAVLQNGTWINGLTTLRLSRRSVDEVKAHHEKLITDYGRVLTEHFRIECTALPFSEWPQFLTTCTEGVLNLENVTVKWPEPPKIETTLGYVRRNQSHLRDQERWRWPSFAEFCGGKRPLSLQQDDLIREVAAEGWSNPHEAINVLCEMNTVQGSGYDQDFYIEIPVYVLIADVGLSTTQHSVRLSYLQHSAIQNLKVIALLKERNPSGADLIKARVPLTLQSTASEDGICVFAGEGKLDTTSRERLVEIKVTHTILGDIDWFQDHLWHLIPEVERNALLAALKRFCPQPGLEDLLVKAYEHKPKKLKTSSAFELHIAWLLGLCGFSPIVLGEYERLLAEKTGVERASVDILASVRKQNILLVGACTISTPKEEDFMNLVHACEILRREVFQDTSVRVFPVLFTGALAQPPYRSVGDEFTIVPIVDADRTAIVLELLEVGAERFFFDFLGNPQLCELRSPKDTPY